MIKSSSASGSSFGHVGRPVLIVGALAIALATLAPSDQPDTAESMCIVCGQFGGVDAFVNVLLYMPLGAGLALLGRKRVPSMLGMVALTVVIELLQRYLIPGRNGAIGDVITNSVGGALGYFVGSHLGQLLLPARRTATWLSGGGLSVWALAHLIGGYALVPSPTEKRYFGQLAHQLGQDSAYDGRILSASLGGRPFPDGEFPNANWVANSLRAPRGAAVDVIAEIRALPRRQAAIARLVDIDEEEIVLLAAEGEDILFGIRTHAADLGLRSPSYRLKGGHPGPSVAGRQSTLLRARYALPSVELSTVSERARRETSMRLSTSNAWRFMALAPIRVDGGRTDMVLDALWLCVLLVPAGYWGQFMVLHRRTRGARVSLGLALLIPVGVGFAVGPAIFGLAPPQLSDIGGASVGLILGALVALWMSRAYGVPGIAER
ncbi:MAG: VanZ family protein [Gemmatimonadota bacterium]